MTRIETERLIIRDYIKQDLRDMHKIWGSPQIMYYLDDMLCETMEQTRVYLKKGLQNEDGHYFAVCEKSSGEFIGSVGYTITDSPPPGKVVHMGYMLLQDYWGRGLMVEAVKAALFYAFTHDGVIRVTTGCVAEHEASRRVMEKSGFHKEGLRTKAQWHDGLMKDRWEYGVNKGDYLV